MNEESLKARWILQKYYWFDFLTRAWGKRWNIEKQRIKEDNRDIGWLNKYSMREEDKREGE